MIPIEDALLVQLYIPGSPTGIGAQEVGSVDLLGTFIPVNDPTCIFNRQGGVPLEKRAKCTAQADKGTLPERLLIVFAIPRGLRNVVVPGMVIHSKQFRWKFGKADPIDRQICKKAGWGSEGHIFPAHRSFPLRFVSGDDASNTTDLPHDHNSLFLLWVHTPAGHNT